MPCCFYTDKIIEVESKKKIWMTEVGSSTWMIEIQIKKYIFVTKKQNLETVCKKGRSFE